MARFANGYINSYRRMYCDDAQTNEFHGDGYLREIWNVLLHWANFRHGQKKLKDRQIPLAPGQLATSIQELSDSTGFSAKKIRNRLNYLKRANSIAIETTKHGSVITICNWERFQGSENDEGKPKGKPKGKRRANGGQPIEEGNKEISNYKSEDLTITPEEPNGPPQLISLWNDSIPSNLPKVNLKTFKPGSKRWKAAKSRLAEEPELAYWQKVIDRIASSAFCTGGNDRGWVATIDFLLRPETHVKAVEGQYDNRKPASAPIPQVNYLPLKGEMQ